MARTGGEVTRNKILEVSEKLFSENGFNGTSVEAIAKTAGVNKALIYYHFKDKNDIIVSLFKNIVKELEEKVERSVVLDDQEDPEITLRKKITEEIRNMVSSKKIISVMLMESLKSTNTENFLFQSAEIVINQEHHPSPPGQQKQVNSQEKHRLFVHEFFTGFIPMITFVVFQDKLQQYFNMDGETLLEYFIDSFSKTHLAAPTPPNTQNL